MSKISQKNEKKGIVLSGICVSFNELDSDIVVDVDLNLFVENDMGRRVSNFVGSGFP